MDSTKKTSKANDIPSQKSIQRSEYRRQCFEKNFSTLMRHYTKRAPGILKKENLKSDHFQIEK